MAKAVSRLPSKEWKVATTGEFSCPTQVLEERLMQHGVTIQFGISNQPYYRSTHLILGPTTTTSKSFGLDYISGHGSDRHKDALRFGIPILTEAELLPLLDEAELKLAKEEAASDEKKKPKKKNKSSAIHKNKSPSKKKSPAKKKKISKSAKVDDASGDEDEDSLMLLLNANDSEDSETFAEPDTESE